MGDSEPDFPSLTGETEPAQRVIRVDQAIDCCSEALNTSMRAFRDLAYWISNLADVGREDRSGLVLVPPGVALPGVSGVSNAPRILRLPGAGAGGAVLVGGAYLIGITWALGEALAEAGRQEIAQALLNTVGGLIRVRTTVKNREAHPCDACMMNRALQQKNPRDRETRRYARRQG